MRKIVKSSQLIQAPAAPEQSARSGGVVKFPQVQLGAQSVVIDNKRPAPPVIYEKPLATKTGFADMECGDIDRERKRLEAFESQLHLEAKRIVGLAQSESESILVQAKVEAQKIFTQAQSNAVELKEQARREGFAQGLAEGRKQGEQKVFTQAKEKLGALESLFMEVEGRKGSLYQEQERELLALTLETTEKIMLQSLEQDGNRILEMLRKAAKGFRNSDYLRITVSALDMTAEMAGDYKLLRELLGDIPHIELERLTEVERGTLIIDNGSELIDASVSTQLNMLREIAAKKGKLSITE